MANAGDNRPSLPTHRMTPEAARAIARRLLLMAGTILGIVFALRPQAQLYRVGVTDFAERQRNEHGWTGRRQMTLSDYIRDRTEGRLLRKDGQAWLDLYTQVATGGEDRFFRPNRPPLDELAGHLDGVFTYVALEHQGDTVYLDVTLTKPGDWPAAPASLRYPMRRFALAAFLAGLLGYLLIPWPKLEPDVVAYSRFTAALLPDLGLGTVLMGMFFALPWFIVTHQAGTSHPLVVPGGWIVLTLILWGMSLFGPAIYVVAAWYETWRLRIGQDHLTMESLRGVEQIPFADIERLTQGVRKPPRWLVRMGMLVSLLNWRAAGPTLLAAGRSDPVLCLVMRDGRHRTIGLTGVRHVERLIAALQQAGVAVDPDLLS